MGQLNLEHKDMGETVRFYSDLRDVYDSNTITLKGYEYFKLFYRYNFVLQKN